jgi:thiol-disulfide isomerase/thioredoxin
MIKQILFFAFLTTICIHRANCQEQNGRSVITGELSDGQMCDSIRLILNEQEYYDFSPYPIEPLKIFTAPVIDGKFKLEITEEIEYPVYIKIDSNMRTSMANHYSYLHSYLLDKGDSVHIEINDQDFSFSGRGAEKFNCIYAMDTTASVQLTSMARYSTATNSVLNNLRKNSTIDNATFADLYYERRIKTLKNRFAIKLNALDKFKSILPAHIYQLLYIDLLLGVEQSSTYESLVDYLGWLSEPELRNLEARFEGLPTLNFDVPENILLKSPAYMKYVWLKVRTEHFFEAKNWDSDEIFVLLTQKDIPEMFKEKLITYHILATQARAANREELIEKALKTQIENPDYRKLLESLLAASTGAAAYNFSLPDLNDKTVKLSDFKGKVVFLDFYYNGCAPCRFYYQQVVSKVKEAYKDNPNIVFIAVSIDKTREKWLQGVESEQYSSFRAVNINTGGVGSNHPIVREYAVRGYPTPILIDKNGNIFNRNAKELRNSIESLKNQIEKALAVN